MFSFVGIYLALTGLAYGSTINHVRPLVVWHGLGDSYASSGMVQFESEVKTMHPGIFVHSVYIDQDANADKRAAIVSAVFCKKSHYKSFPVWECGPTACRSC